jgi:hypothetical protein
MGVSVQPQAPAALPLKEPRCLLNRRLDVPQSRSGRFGEGTNILNPPENRRCSFVRHLLSVVTALTELFVAYLQSTAATQLHCCLVASFLFSRREVL